MFDFLEMSDKHSLRSGELLFMADKTRAAMLDFVKCSKRHAISEFWRGTLLLRANSTWSVMLGLGEINDRACDKKVSEGECDY